MTNSFTIPIHSNKTFRLNQHLFYETSMIVVNFKSENCNLKFSKVTEEAEIFSNKPDYYQLIFSSKKIT